VRLAADIYKVAPSNVSVNAASWDQMHAACAASTPSSQAAHLGSNPAGCPGVALALQATEGMLSARRAANAPRPVRRPDQAALDPERQPVSGRV
jgi:hypothetical protein